MTSGDDEILAATGVFAREEQMDSSVSEPDEGVPGQADLPAAALPAIDIVAAQATLAPLRPLPYHDEIVALLRREEPEAWQWACSVQTLADRADEVRAMLLKQTYRLDATAHAALHASCERAAARLGVAAPISLYQASEGGMNAALHYLPGEAHIVFSGPLLDRLQDAELEAVCGHELAHYLLWSGNEGRYLAADRLLAMACAHPNACASLCETARLYALATEIFADRGGAIGCAGLEPAVAALVKVQTGLAHVSAASYLVQADEICNSLDDRSDAASHPELFIRARALRLWCEAGMDDARVNAADDWLRAALEGALRVDALDMTAQVRLAALTRRVIMRFLLPHPLRSETLLAHARRFFDDLVPDERPDATLRDDIVAAPGTHDYVAALLLDFALADRSLEDVPFAAAIDLSQSLGLPDAFERLALEALKMPKRQFAKARNDAPALLARALGAHA